MLLAVGIFAMGAVFWSSENSASRYGEEDRWWHLFTEPLSLFTLGLVVVGTFQLFLFRRQLHFMRESLVDAKKAADAAAEGAEAARLNAQSLVDAESAQMYYIQTGSNIEQMFTIGKLYDNSPTMAVSMFDAPWVGYRLRNYGKSPAIARQVIHGISLENPKVKQSREYVVGQEAMEIIGVGEQGIVIRCVFDKPLFTFGEVRSILNGEKLLFFYGQAEFMDHFGRKQTLEWEFLADDGKWNFIGQQKHSRTRQGEPI